MFKNMITDREKMLLDRIQNDCKEIHLFNPPVCFLSYEVKDKNGIQIDAVTMLSKSWVRNFYNLIATSAMGVRPNQLSGQYGEGSLLAKNTGGSIQSVTGYILCPAYDTYWLGHKESYLGEANDINRGIVIGSSDAAEDFDHHRLSSIIESGTSAGQISYQRQDEPTILYDAAQKKYIVTHKRIFNNNGSAPVEIKEIGWYRHYIGGSGSKSIIMLSRDVLQTAVSVPASGQFTAIYTLEMVFPA